MLVPIKPVKCGCGSEKFKEWYRRYVVTPLPNESLLDLRAGANVTINGSPVLNGDTINDVNVTTFKIYIKNVTLTSRTFSIIGYDSDNRPTYLYYGAVAGGSEVTATADRVAGIVRYQFSDGFSTLTVTNDNTTDDIVLSDFITSDLITSTEDEFFNSYYANWCIVDPFNDFESELKVAFMLAEDKLTAYKSQLTDFTPGAHTVMTVDYGERGNTDYGYRYPIGGDVDTSAPNTGAKATVDAVTDTTTVDKNEEPFKNLDKTKAMDGWLRFFVDQFKDCFTLCEGMTW